MIESISFSKVATYPDAPEVMNQLKSLNFIYGSNGAGKTTIGKVIADPSLYPNCIISWKGAASLQTFVYNRDFVDRNFKPSEDLKGVFTLGEQEIETLKKITNLKSERDSLSKKIEGWNEALQGVDGTGGKLHEVSTLEAVFKEKCWAQKVKHDSKLQGGFEGVRNNSERFKNRVLESIKITVPLLSLDELTKKAETVFGRTPVIESMIRSIDTEQLVAHESNPILKKRVIGKSDVDIAAMINKLGNSDWVKEGRGYFDENGKVCPFCQQATKDSFAKSLDEYFDETFLNDSKSIRDLATSYKTESERLQQQLSLIIAVPGSFLDVSKLKEEKELLDSKLIINAQRIAAKNKESSQPVELESVGNVIAAITTLISAANDSIENHNRMVKNLSAEKQELTTQIWRFVTEELRADIADYQVRRANLDKAVKGLQDQIQQAKAEQTLKVKEIRELERLTTSVQPTVDAINGLLQSFGFHGFSIANIPNTTLYRLVRNDGTAAMKTMSEGEKTFVTFLYFFQLIKGSETESGMTDDRVVVFDDPVSSLDSDILFIVGSLIKGLFEEVRAKRGNIKQIFVLTHNVYFHKEITFSTKRRNGKALGDESFWIVRKLDQITKLESYQDNPIKTSYELLWGELRRADRSNLTIQNTLRRILENYFKILGNIDFDDICTNFEGREKLICRSLLSWVNDGSHFAHDDIYVSDGTTVTTYLKVFKDIFYKLKHDAHYRMMMREDEDESETVSA